MQDRSDTRSRRRAAAFAALAVLGPALGGATQLWSQAALLLGLAALLIFSPPRRSAGLLWNTLFLAIFALAVPAFLPARWFPMPAWRQTLVTDHQIDLPGTFSPQPWLSAHAACLLLAGIAFAYYLIAQPWDSRARRKVARVYLTGIAVVVVSAIVSNMTGQKVPFWPQVLNSDINFGFFPNRNQTANVLALAAILAAALTYDSFARKRKLAWFWLFVVVLMGVALKYAGSRAGILLVLGGIAAWTTLSFSLVKSGKSAALGISCIALVLALFIVFGGGTFDRVRNIWTGGTTDFRVPIQADALALSAKAPWFGQTLANFKPVFTMARVASVAQNRTIHPESDWLWTAVEMGWPAVFLILATCLCWLRDSWPISTGSDRVLRAAALVCGVAFAVHAGFDVSGHRPGSAWPALLIAALALKSERRLVPRRWVAPVFRLLGIALAGIAGWWLTTIFSERLDRIAPTPQTLARVIGRFEGARAAGDFGAAHRFATTALQIAPLDSDLYYQRAVVRVAEGFSIYGAQQDFKTARFLEPNWTDLCFSEGKIWIAARQSDQAMEAWTEALRRAGPDAPAWYGRMIDLASSNFAMHSALAEVARTNQKFLLIFLKYADAIESDIEIGRLLETDPALKNLSSDQRKSLFAAWFDRGNRAKLLSELAARPDWQKDGWLWMARGFTIQMDYERAFAIAMEFSKPPLIPPVAQGRTLLELEWEFRNHATNLVHGVALYFAQLEAGQADNALTTISELETVRACPPYIVFLKAQVLAKLGKWEAAWNTWERFAATRPHGQW